MLERRAPPRRTDLVAADSESSKLRTSGCFTLPTVKRSAQRRMFLLGALALLVAVLEALGYRILGSLGDLTTASVWTWALTLLILGFIAGRRIEKAIRRRDAVHQGHRP